MAFLLVWIAGAPIDFVRSFGPNCRGLSSVGCKLSPGHSDWLGLFLLQRDRRRRADIGMARARKVMAARVIPWENQYGIAVVFERGNHVAYPVGDREEAERQVQLVLNHPYDSAVLRKADD